MWNPRIYAVALMLISGLIVADPKHCAASEPPGERSDRSRKEVVTVALQPSVQTDSRVIRLVDVAKITGGDALLREQVKQLDLEDGLTPGESVTILPPQIEFRLRIAGIDVDRVSIRGRAARVSARSTSATREAVVTSTGATAPVSATATKPRRAVDFSSISVDEGPLEREIIQAAKKCLINKLPWPAENIDIRLTQPISLDVRQVKSAVGYECSAELRTSGPPIGRVQVRVVAEASNQATYDVLVQLEARHFERVVLATKTIDRGHLIAASDLYLDRQDVTELSDYCSSASELVGTTAKRSIRALLPVRTNDVEGQTRTETSVLIKRREQVKMVARVGALVVTATGEALQDGRLGEIIKVRNIESNANVQGRVTGTGEVEISF